MARHVERWRVSEDSSALQLSAAFAMNGPAQVDALVPLGVNNLPLPAVRQFTLTISFKGG
ncbi:hypothetical protein PS880_03490 [Pseudomonas fluorescens]|uniref:Uncharacterized protein n=1 Tax=Pseudomonas fluorescens TaxID=294 RepID=A0A5E7LSZ7_PSEFL|nr:hypothetical protein PS880_03490 [Pseudomonas fluorescens]